MITKKMKGLKSTYEKIKKMSSIPTVTMAICKKKEKMVKMTTTVKKGKK